MIEQVLLRDGHLSGVGQQRVDDVVKGSWDLGRSTNDDVSACVRNFCDETLRSVDTLPDAFGWMLWANAYSYNAVETTWKEDRVTFAGPKGEVIGPVNVMVPDRFDAVHPKHFRFDLRTDEPLLWLNADHVSLPFGKFIFMRGEGYHPITERLGYMWPCVWYSMFRSISWAGWATFVDRFGMPVPLIEYDAGIAQYSEYKAAYSDILNSLGSGKGAVFPRDGTKFTIQDPPRGGTSSDPHSALSDACDAAQSVRVLGATLTAKIGNVGSFAASSAHLEVKYSREEADARRLWAAMRRDLLMPLVLFNSFALARALNDAGYRATPELLQRRVPYGQHCVPREVEPSQRMQQYMNAVNELGLDVSREGAYREFNLPQSISKADRIPGKAQQISSGGAVVGAVEASEGVMLPQKPTSTPAPEKAPLSPPRAAEG